MENDNQIIYTNIYDLPEIYGLTYLHPNTWISKHKDSSMYVWSHPSFTDVASFDRNAIYFVQKNKNARLFINNTPEGYVYPNLKIVYELVSRFNLHNKVIYGTGNPDAELEYKQWLIKKNLIKNFDVYYHSFWYSNCKQTYIDYEFNFSIDKSKWFCCLNNRPHPHRLQTVTYLDYFNLTNLGIVTCLDKHYEDGCDQYTYDQILLTHLGKYSEEKRTILHEQSLITGPKLPMNFDTEDFSQGSRPTDYNPEIYNNCLINLVTETWYHKNWSKNYHNFLSEKIWKSIMTKQIFIVIGPQYTLKYLKDIGFKTFSDYIDESYDNLDDDQRLFAAVESLKYATERYSIQELNDLTKDIREYNLELFNAGVSELQPKLQSLLCT